jgi:anthranilate phosphoribosyltransferase
MFAQAFHPAMKYAATPRKEIGIRTVFNILGPLTNPAGAQYQVIGVPTEEIGNKIAGALVHLHITRALVVHGLNGIDELSISGKSAIWEVRGPGEEVSRRYISPEELGLKSALPDSVKGGDPLENAGILRSVLNGEKTSRRDVVLLNAAAGIYVGGLVATLKEAVDLASQSIDNGRAAAKLDRLVDFSGRLA